MTRHRFPWWIFPMVAALAACSTAQPPPPSDTTVRPETSESPDGPSRRTFRVVAELPVEPGAEALQILETRPGVTVRFLLSIPRSPAAVVVLFPGGDGRLGIDISGRVRRSHGNFLIRSRRLFGLEGLVVASLDAPSDRNGSGGLHGRFRGSQEHAADVAGVTAYLRRRFGVPVWLVGTSRGTISVANAAIRVRAGTETAADGLVMMASVTKATRRGTQHLAVMRLGAISQPVLLVHHRKDRCRVSPHAGAEWLQRALTGARTAELLAYDGGESGDKPCQGRSHHGFLGIERGVVRDVAAWIKARRAPPTLAR